MSAVELGMMTAMRSGPAATAGMGREATNKATARATIATINRLRVLILYPHWYWSAFQFSLCPSIACTQLRCRTCQPKPWLGAGIKRASQILATAVLLRQLPLCALYLLPSSLGGGEGRG